MTSFFSEIPAFAYTLIVLGVVFIIATALRNRRAKQAQTQTVADNPALERPVTIADMQTVSRTLDQAALPYQGFVAQDKAPAGALESRLGGGIAAPDGAAWPVGRGGAPLIHLAQINLSEFAAVPEFPAAGVVQFFIGADKAFGLDFDDQLRSDHLVLFHQDTNDLTAFLRPPHDPNKQRSPFLSEDVWLEGRRLAPGRSGPMRPGWDVWPLDETLQDIWERPGGEEQLEDLFESFDYEAHRLGGHPSFTQQDPRAHEALLRYSRTLLQVGCDDFIMFGDSGECSFFITAEDLKALRFDRTLYSWDCC